jgi:cytochrome c peroxidase
MHDGRFATLAEVIDHYARGGGRSGRAGAARNPLLPGFSLTESEKRDLTAFLESLTDADFLRDPRFADPWKP